ncbi:hypothetical protein BQ8482_360180 [Mesorhizobium delmotii]|uniref:Uncharacterized protein n=1 Tax=Mesorhizobium delmotii TaxID=1631247 RepID=A0A2P9ARL0_9HYPH|nr:hypothetical protein BQ8482_360180 [Mesorhizobium delmotii]
MAAETGDTRTDERIRGGDGDGFAIDKHSARPAARRSSDRAHLMTPGDETLVEHIALDRPEGDIQKEKVRPHRHALRPRRPVGRRTRWRWPA